MQIINKSTTFKTLKDLVEYIDKLLKQSGLISYNIAAASNLVNKQENYRLDWIVEGDNIT